MKAQGIVGAVQSSLLHGLPAIVLAFGLLITHVLDVSQRQLSYDALNREFSARAQDIFERVSERLEDYGQVMRGGRGLFAVNEVVGRSEWRKYVEALGIERYIPGIQAVSYSQAVKREEKSGYLEGIRREGFPDFAIHPAGDRDWYTPVTYIEPFSGRNLRAFGYDTYSESVRRAAMESARDEDRIAMSGKVRLIQETESDPQAGFLLYSPVYRNNAPHDTIQERRENLKGWVSAPFRMTDFMKSLVGRGFMLNGGYLDIIVFDGDGVRADQVMYHYDNDVDPVIAGGRKPLLLSRRLMTFAGHSWTIVVHSPFVFDSQYSDNRAVLIDIFGVVISLLAAVISWLLLASGASRQRRRRSDPGSMPIPRSSEGVWLTRAAPYGLAAIMSAAAGFVVVMTDQSERLAQSHAERTEVENQLEQIRLRLERALTVPMARVRGMAAQIIAHDGIAPDEFRKVAEVLVRGHPTIRNIGVSHGTKLDFIYPLTGNEGALGFDYRNVVGQWPVVKQAIETRSTVIQGPVSLIQGGEGLVIREPVFLQDEHGERNRLFGLVSLVLNIPEVYAEVGLDRELPIKIAIRGRNGLGLNGAMILGDESLFSDGHAVELNVEFPYGRWALAGLPKDGWGSSASLLSVSRLMGGGFFVFVVLVSFGTARHTIERRALLRQVGMSEERFRRLLAIASDGVHILDAQGRLVMWSNSFLEMLGYDESDAGRLHVGDWDRVYSREELLPKIRELFARPAVFETRHRRKDGSEFDVEINAGGIELGGRTYLYASSRDISERKAHDEALRQAKVAAEEGARAKSDFLAMMSHEIRTPITSVLGMADLLGGTPLTAQQSGYLGIMRSSTKTLLTILNDILDISKIEAGKVELEATAFLLPDAVREVVELGQGSASAKGLRLEMIVAPDVPEAVIGDPTRLKQVLFNLLSNAIKFTERGAIGVRIAVERQLDQGAFVRIAVEDTGIGIDGEQAGRLFEAFSQADRSTTRRFGGTGLGLAIARKLVELMGGTIGVESEPGKGATFWFLVPFKLGVGAVPPSETAPIMPPAQQCGPLRILLAEDNPINQMLVRTMLQKSGHTVRVVENGRLAVAAVAAEDFDIVLMDMQMPEMGGEEATRAIRALLAPKNRVPVLALTADVMAEHREQYLRAGVDGLVAKPIDWRLLSEAIGTAVGTGPAMARQT